ncbi:DUF859 family phage minor structural protein [Bacillota bacterium Meth-B3]
MPTVTINTSTGPRWGDSGFSSSTEYLKVGKSGTATYYGRFGFPAINKSWYIKSVKLRMKRVDSYSSKTLKVGSRPDADWDTKTQTDFTLSISVSSGENTKEWDLTAYKAVLQGYAGTWYMHVRHGSGDNSYCEFSGGTGSSSPRLVIEYEEATLTVPNGEFTIGAASAITVGTAGSGLTHKVSYSIGASSGALNGGVAVDAGGTISWTPPAALANEIKDSMVGTVRLTLESYLDGALSSTLSFDYPLKVPASYVPVINSGSTTFTLSNPAGDTVGVYVQGRSRAVCAINVTLSYGAPIKEYKLTIGGKTYTAAAGETAVNPFSITTDVLAATGALTAVIEVTDTRGQKATLTRASAVTVNSYFTPMVTGLSLARALSDGSLSNDGAYIKFTLSCSFAAIANKNTKAGSIKFKAAGGSYSAAISLDSAMASAGATVYSFMITGVIGSGAIGSGSYVVSVTLADRYATAPEVLAELPGKKIYFDLHSSGEGMAIGKVASTASLFDVGLKSNYDQAAQMRKGFYVHSAGGTGGSAGWIQICRLTITAAYINCPIEIGISQRGLGMPSRLFIFFANLNGTDPALGSFTYAGKIKSAYINRTAAGVWDVYVEKTETYDTVGVVDFKSPPYMSGLTVAWTNTQVASVPAGAVKATYAYGDGEGLLALGIQRGIVATTLPNNGTRTGSVTFSVPYAAGTTPNMQLTLSGIVGSYDRPMKLAVTALSNTGFTWSLTYASSSNNACDVHWISIGDYA